MAHQRLSALFMLALMLVAGASALSVSPASKDVIGPEPTSYVLSIQDIDGHAVAVTVTGNASQFITVDADGLPVSDSGTVKVTLRPVAGALPGHYSGGVLLEPVPGEQDQMIQALPAVQHRIGIIVPREGAHLEATLLTSAPAAEEETLLTVMARNVGTEPITDATVELSIGDEAWSAALPMLNPGASGRAVFSWTAPGPGAYTAAGLVRYAGKARGFQESILVGDLEAILGTPSFGPFSLGEVVRLDVPLTSSWNQRLRNVNAEYTLRGPATSTSFTGLSVDLPPRGTANLTGYWNSAGAVVGEYALDVEAHYAGKTTRATYPVVVGVDSIDIQNDDESSLLWYIAVLVVVAAIGVWAWTRRR